MQCIHCGRDTKYKVRKANGGKCGSCGHPFAFEPRDYPRITDRFFQQTIQAVDGRGRVFFTERQLWYEVNRRLRRRRWNYFLLRLFRRPPGLPSVPPVEFRRAYVRPWLEAHGPIEKLLPAGRRAPSDQRQAPPSHRPPSELSVYSFDRAVVADHAEIAAMLVANNFHFENNCAVLSLDGYPSGVADTVLAMLRRNPNLQVCAVHDASPEGCALPLALRREPWFPEPTVRVLDLGLRPRHVRALRLHTLIDDGRVLAPEVRALLTPEEIAWLEQGNRAELAALRPARLMRTIFQAFSRPPGGADSEGGAADGDSVWFYDSEADVHAADSFG